jgi:hypothetical protein
LIRAGSDNFSTFAPAPFQSEAVGVVLDQVVAWSTALATLRSPF